MAGPSPICTGKKKRVVEGDPDQAHISTSYVERANLSIRMQNRRFTRLTNAFSKKLDNQIHALALYFAFYFVRIHKTLKITPHGGGDHGSAVVARGYRRGD